MSNVYDKENKPIVRSRNMRGVRGYVGRRESPPIKRIHISRVDGGRGWLRIEWDGGAHFRIEFASFSVLCDVVSRWTNVQGAPMSIDGKPAGEVTRKMPRDAAR